MEGTWALTNWLSILLRFKHCCWPGFSMNQLRIPRMLPRHSLSSRTCRAPLPADNYGSNSARSVSQPCIVLNTMSIGSASSMTPFMPWHRAWNVYHKTHILTCSQRKHHSDQLQCFSTKIKVRLWTTSAVQNKCDHFVSLGPRVRGPALLSAADRAEARLP